MSKKQSRNGSNSTAALQTVLADVYVLAVKTHGFHWNVEGPTFAQLHVMLEDQYKALFAAADDVAERLRALDAYAPGSFAQFKQLASISEETKVLDAKSMLTQLVEDYEKLTADIEEALDVSDEAEDGGTDDLLTGLLRDGQKTAWMLKATLRGK